MDQTIYTLHEYRLRYPDSAEVPTLTQSGLLAVLLDRQRQKAANRARRDAMWRSIWDAPRRICVGVWRAVTSLELRHSTSRGDLPTRQQALNP
ncbi:MAG TPA: hypothetical protein VE860_17155 [Chthoniobacterales bacterium]|nr:hypothetical protein [Chthoniobacterales bacterium]